MVLKRISCAANNYAWGVPGSKSTVAQLAGEAVKDFAIDEGAPYAELWMSTHPKGIPKCLSTFFDVYECQFRPSKLLG